MPQVIDDGVIEYKPFVNGLPKKEFKRCITPLGSKYYYKAKLSVDKITGQKIAERGEKVDLDAVIQSYVSSCDIAAIVERYKNGDETVLNVNSGYEGDVTILPKNINDVVGTNGLFDKAYESFQKMPDEVKALFNNDPSRFFNSVIENKVDDTLAAYQASVVAKEKEKASTHVESQPIQEGGNE